MHDFKIWLTIFYLQHPPLPMLYLGLPKFILGFAVSILFHEMGHVIAGEMTPIPASGICMGRFSFGYGWYWSSKGRWGILSGRIDRPKPEWRKFPHVYSFPYPSTGWTRIVKSAGGPIGSFICFVLMVLYIRYVAFYPWHTEPVVHVGEAIYSDGFYFGLLIMSWVGVMNLIPRRGETALIAWIYRRLPFTSSRAELWLEKRAKSRVSSDGDKIWSAIVRSRRGRRWRGRPRK